MNQLQGQSIILLTTSILRQQQTGGIPSKKTARRHIPIAVSLYIYMDVGQNPGTPGEPIKIAGKWMFIPLKMVLIGIDPCFGRLEISRFVQ
jgi:hypothetical protein